MVKRAENQKPKRRVPRRRTRTQGPQGVYGGTNVIRAAAPGGGSSDLYHALLTMSWTAMIGLTAAAYLVINAVFALLYLADRGSIANAGPDSFTDAFFFSVQTMATIGYGAMYPKTLFANIVVTVETVVGLLSFALMTGLWFTRFSRPTARVAFSRVAVIEPRQSVPTLLFRMANERRNQILQAEVRVTLVRDERSAEGAEVRRLHDLALIRDHSAFFTLSWTVGHPINSSSPLYGETAESLVKTDAQIVVLLAGIDETLNQTVHARCVYTSRDILWGHRFADILTRGDDGERVIDLRRLHDTVPVAVPAALSAAAAGSER